MSDSVRPHRWQPMRLPCPWDSPGKNTGVGCYVLLQCMKVKGKLLSCAQLFTTPWTAAYQAPPPMGFSRQEYWSGVPLPSPRLCLRSKQFQNIIISNIHSILLNNLILTYSLKRKKHMSINDLHRNVHRRFIYNSLQYGKETANTF